VHKPILQIIALNTAVIVLCLAGFAAKAETQNPDQHPSPWAASLDLAAGDNPTTLALLGEVFRRKIYHRDPSPLWDGLYYQGGAQFTLTPAFGRLGVHFQWLPVAVMQLRLQLDHYEFFGRYGSLLSYASGHEPYGDHAIETRKGEETTGNARRLLLQPTLQAKWGRVILRNITDLAVFDFSGPGPYYHEWEYDVLLKTRDRLLRNRLMLLYEINNQKSNNAFLLGPMVNVMRSYHAGIKRTSLGAMAYLFMNQKFRLWLQVARYSNDPNRDNEAYFLAGLGTDFKIPH
jgi:hypothetical protein